MKSQYFNPKIMYVFLEQTRTPAIELLPSPISSLDKYSPNFQLE